MALVIVTGGTTGGTDGTPISEGGARTNPLAFPALNTVYDAHVRTDSGSANDDAWTLPTGLSISFDGGASWLTGASQTGVEFGPQNRPVKFRQTSAQSPIASIDTAYTPVSLTGPAISGSLTATSGAAKVTLSGPTATDNVAVDHWVIEYGTTTGYGSTQAVSGATFVSTDVAGLTNGTPYYFRVKAYDAAGNASTGLTASATPVGAPLADVTGFVMTPSLTIATSMDFAWSAVANRDHYQVDIATSADFTTGLVEDIFSSGTGTSGTKTGLSADTRYYGRIKAHGVGYADSPDFATDDEYTAIVADTFSDSSLDTTHFGAVVANGGTATEGATGLVLDSSGLNTRAAFCYYKTPLAAATTGRYDWYYQVYDAPADLGGTEFMYSRTAAPVAESQANYVTNRRIYPIVMAGSAAGDWYQYYKNAAGTHTTQDSATGNANIKYLTTVISRFEVDSANSRWRHTFLNAAGTIIDQNALGGVLGHAATPRATASWNGSTIPRRRVSAGAP